MTNTLSARLVYFLGRCGYVVLAGVLVSGCATALDPKKDSLAVARIVGCSPEDIQFMSYCSYAVGMREAKGFPFFRGMLVITPVSVMLHVGSLEEVPKAQEIRLPYGTMKGVDLRHFGFGRQVQILVDEHVVAINVTKNRPKIDEKGSEEVFGLITKHGVKPWKSERFYSSVDENSGGDRETPTAHLQVRPTPMFQSRPFYPLALSTAGISGTVLVDFIVDREGVPRNLLIASSSNIAFNESALDCVSHWRFAPGTIDGHAVFTHMQVPIVYSPEEK
jgi:TonB family protein